MEASNESAEIIIYQTSDGETSIDVTLANDTVWLTVVQLAELFQNTRQNIGLHLKHIFEEGELDRNTTIREKSLVQKEGNRNIQRKVEQYSLDVIISVGYRVKSKQGTDFRIWANKVLKTYLLKGYALNEKRLQDKTEQYESLKKAVSLITNVTSSQAISGDEAAGLLHILKDYTYALDVLDKYDHQVLEIEATSPLHLFEVTYSSAMEAINLVKRVQS